jgi:multiple sugar transport system ATP-binding protein
MMADLTLSGVSKTFGPTRVLNDVSLSVRDGEFLTLVGASGCGKSTILRVIAGLEPQDAGTVQIGGRAVDHLRPKQRNVAMVFQSYALYPHMSVQDNMAMPLVMSRMSLAERLPLLGRVMPRRREVMAGISAEVDTVARQLQIEALLGRKPAQLSGGQRQRVALGRAMVRHPDVFLMDEPLSNLDAKLRVHMRTELTELHRRLGVTFIYVTHDQVEAMTMSDRVALMDEGRIVQLGTPADLYHNPTDLRVARFIGSPQVNIVSGTTRAEGIAVSDTVLPLQLGLPAGQVVSVGLRPESLSLEAAPGRARLMAKLAHVENLGAEVFLHFMLPDSGDPLVLRATLDAFEAHRGRLDQAVALSVDTSRALVFDTAGRRVEIAGRQAALRPMVQA